MSTTDATVALVTGGTSGIGRETVRRLAESGATVHVHGRDAERGEAVCAEVAAETDGDAQFHAADFADFDAVRDLAAAVRDRVGDGQSGDLDVLVNNAGTWQGERRLIDATGERTDDARAGVEFTVAVNHCAHFLLTAELWPLLRRADGPHGEGARVITVSSDLHRRVDFDIDALTGPEGPSGQAAYAHSKLANVCFAAELTERAADTDVTANSCHPGVAPGTALARETTGIAAWLWEAFGVVGRALPVGPVDTAAEAADTQCWLATAPEAAAIGGKYVVDREATAPSAAAKSRENRHQLWEWTANVVGVDPAFPAVGSPADGGGSSDDDLFEHEPGDSTGESLSAAETDEYLYGDE